MRVLMISKALVVGAYQRKLEELASLPGVELLAVIPPEWREGGHTLRYEPLFRQGYQTVLLPLALNGHYHLHFYRGLHAVIERFQPEIIHLDEEPADVVALQAVALAGRARLIFFTWQNLLRRVPPPFSIIQRRTFQRAGMALCGNRAAVDVLRAKGYCGPTRVVPQFGCDTDLFASHRRECHPDQPFLIGSAGRLVPEKGMDLVIGAAARLERPWRLEIAGDGPEAAALQRLAGRLGVAGRVAFLGRRPSAEMPALLARWDVLVMASRSRPNWQEQFGRSAVEAMSCGTPVIVSRSAELPNVVGDAGLTFPEDDAGALLACLKRLAASPELRRQLGAAGRARVLAHFTQRAVATATYAAY
ncbi:MAG TPA: glycosyltransferase family 4 protein, partial [Chloroflexota bacterium]|nr:glycosyltransferase family 4 protein [Chloroflexota bacterium]